MRRQLFHAACCFGLCRRHGSAGTRMQDAMTTLVTGATGFVGSAVARALAARGHELRLLTRAGQRPAQPGGPGRRGGDRRPDRSRPRCAGPPRAAAMSFMSRPTTGSGCPIRTRCCGPMSMAPWRWCAPRPRPAPNASSIAVRSPRWARSATARRRTRRRRPTRPISSASTSGPNTLPRRPCWTWRGATGCRWWWSIRPRRSGRATSSRRRPAR